jgi:hypothetical protein
MLTRAMIDLDAIEPLARQLVDAHLVGARPGDPPSAWADQIAAAVHDQATGVTRVAELMGATVRHVNGDHEVEAITLLLLDLCHPCRHLLDNVRRRASCPVYALPAIGLACCPRCIDRRYWRTVPEGDLACDVCGEEPEDGLWTVALTLGVLAVFAAVCDICRGRINR